MDYQDYIPDAIELVDGFEINNEADWRQAVLEQARTLAGIDLELRADIPVFSPYLALQF